ncbi:hypothetical protein HYR69_10055 [Candidatus Sumerlaeota bacterium]|nr:hypothetical protein [Candidatus Sumerlaeota bacterium]
MIAYETYLRNEPGQGLKEVGMFFEHRGPVHDTLHRIASRLDELGIPYAIAGAMALYYHGYARLTSDVDVIVTSEGLKKLHDELEGLGYAPLFRGSKNLRDTETGVKIDFIVTGGFPGDGKPKPVAFPDPQNCVIELDRVKFLKLSKLVELKLASGLSDEGRMKDIADVLEFMKAVEVPRSLADELDPSVRDKFLHLWELARDFRAQGGDGY